MRTLFKVLSPNYCILTMTWLTLRYSLKCHEVYFQEISQVQEVRPFAPSRDEEDMIKWDKAH